MFKTLNDNNFYKKQKRIVLGLCGVIDPENIDEYIAYDGYMALAKALTEMTPDEIIETLRDFNFFKIKAEGYAPAYKRTELTDVLHESFGFRTDYEIVTNKVMKNICNSKNRLR